MSKHQRLGQANTNSGHYRYWNNMLNIANLNTSDAFWAA